MLGYYNYTVILTYIGMMIGFTGITLIFDGRYTQAILCLMIAGICDMFDGAIAATKERNEDEKNFGIQIDSLSDLICFGAFPAIFLYGIGRPNYVSLFVSVAFLLCALIRLSFFNVDEAKRQKKCEGSRKEYLGLPVTTTALILPATYEIGEHTNVNTGTLCTIVLAVVAIAYITPIKLKKPKIVGKLCMIVIGILELTFVLAGVDL